MGIGLGQALAIGNACVEQQGGFGWLNPSFHNQPRLAPQPDQAGLAGPPAAAQSPQIAVLKVC